MSIYIYIYMYICMSVCIQAISYLGEKLVQDLIMV